MPELKNSFTGGKMEKDLDERIVPRGQYREALNISVATSEDSNVGAAQNILGNIKVTSAIQGWREDQFGDIIPSFDPGVPGFNNQQFHIAQIVDPQTDMLYRFVKTRYRKSGEQSTRLRMDRIVEYDTTKSISANWWEKERAVFVDIYETHVKWDKFDPDRNCDYPNQSRIRLVKTGFPNVNQVRWGMKMTGLSITEPATVLEVDYSSGWIILDKPMDFTHPQIVQGPQGPQQVYNFGLTFKGDRVLNFDKDRHITGLNIVDGMLFWTDNYSEPKKINIERCKKGSDTSDNGVLRGIEGLRGRGSEVYTRLDDFVMHTLLVIDDKYQKDCMKDEYICARGGCTDPAAFNYDWNAFSDDGSCCYTGGCTNPTACNYDANACFDDGSCVYTSYCMDDGSGTFPSANRPANWVGPASNYVSSAVCHDGSLCTYTVPPPTPIWGCTDPMATNYDPTASIDCSLPMPANAIPSTLGCPCNVPSYCYVDVEFKNALVADTNNTLLNSNFIPVSGSINYNPTNQWAVLASDVANITIVSIGSGQISGGPIDDITGIECFTALEELYMNGQSVTSFDLSNNLSLRKLMFSGNKVEVFDLTANVNLTHLNCSKNYNVSNGSIVLDQVDLTQNTALTHLYATDLRDLHVIDLSQNAQLIHLDLNRSAIQGMLNLLPNPNLEYINVENCSLTGLNQQSNPLHTLICSNDDGSSWASSPGSNDFSCTGCLNISNNPNLEVFKANRCNIDYTGVDYFLYNPELREVQVIGNKFRHIDLSQTKATTIWVWKQGGTTQGGVPGSLEVLKINNGLNYQMGYNTQKSLYAGDNPNLREIKVDSITNTGFGSALVGSLNHTMQEHFSSDTTQFPTSSIGGPHQYNPASESGIGAPMPDYYLPDQYRIPMAGYLGSPNPSFSDYFID